MIYLGIEIIIFSVMQQNVFKIKCKYLDFHVK